MYLKWDLMLLNILNIASKSFAGLSAGCIEYPVKLVFMGPKIPSGVDQYNT